MMKRSDSVAWRLAVRHQHAFLALCALLAALIATSPVRAFETSAPTAVLVDLKTGRTLFEKNADERIAPASLAKLMTVAVLFQALREGEITEETTYSVSEKAWREGGASSGGSTMFLPLGSTVSVKDLLNGIIVQSGNDATIVAAEGLSGSEEAFASRMNELAAEIGLTSSHFTNPHGLPDPAQYVTVRDLTRLAAWLIEEFPKHYELFSKESFTFNGITQNNRNPLLDYGADGLKTGHTSEAGYGLVASGTRDGRRVILAISGMKSASERAREARRLLDFGLQDFEEVTLVTAGETVGRAQIRNGTSDAVPMAAKFDASILVPRGSLADVQRVVRDNGPVTAPIEKGRRIGWVTFVDGDAKIAEVPLVADENVEEAGLINRLAGTIALALSPEAVGGP